MNRVIVLLCGRKNGNTKKILNRLEKYMDVEDLFFDYVHLKENNPDFCKNCYSCFNRGEEYCPNSDYIQPIIKKITNAQGLILTSPLYSESIHGLMKNFLDMTSYLYHRPKFFNIKGLALTTVTGVFSHKSVNYLQNVLRRWGIYKPLKSHFFLNHTDIKEEKINDKKVKNIATKFSKEINSGIKEKPSISRLIWFAIWRRIIFLSKDSRDYEYWSKMGWFNKRFYFEESLSPLKRVISSIFIRLSGKINF